jgi:hypothetical protein
MTKHNNYTVIGFKALQRAALKVAEDARKNNYKIPVWRNGRIVYKIPEVTTERIRIDRESEANHDLIR